jgi:hypothetical protein
MCFLFDCCYYSYPDNTKNYIAELDLIQTQLYISKINTYNKTLNLLKN